MAKLTIGITTGADLSKYASYAESVKEAGGEHKFLPPKPAAPEHLEADLRGVDGLLIAGGLDVHPDFFHAWNEPGDEGLGSEELIEKYRIRTDRERDAYEIPLVQLAYEKRIPILAICRGFQVLNVALGGGLVMDIRTGLRHRAYGKEESAMHAVCVDPNSRVSYAIGTWPCVVNSRHHQGITIKEKAEGLEAVAFAPDGIVEAMEGKEHPWALAVQWHPEKTSDTYVYEPCKALFRTFVAAARDLR